MAARAMKIYAGTSGYSYKEWKGNFYPADLAAGEMLRFYGTHLPAVEINNTFYRLPKASVLAAWREQVPATFRFILKASRRITHIKRLKNTSDETTYLFDTVATLGDLLGGVLFQLPPNFRKDVPRLEEFLDLVPQGVRTAFEFRHPSWFEDDVVDCLRRRSCALCTADMGDDDAPEAPLVDTADWGYLRLRRPGYSKEDLTAWMHRIQAQDWKEAFVFFKHEDEGVAPQLATELLALASST
jgi:uncharacterized protein YecE (DUF72 family)